MAIDVTNLTGEQVRAVHDIVQRAVRGIRAAKVKPTHGFCGVLHQARVDYFDDNCTVWYEIDELSDAMNTLNKLWGMQWEHYSGDPSYPVPAPSDYVVTDTSRSAASRAYAEKMYERRMWDKRTRYGRMRWEYVDYIESRATELWAQRNGGAINECA